MAYSNFTLRDIRQQFGLTIAEHPDLFNSAPEAAPSALLRDGLAEGVPLALAISTEKARSEMIVAPILVEVRRQLRRTVSLFSGVDFTVDAARGLNGVCDFILARSPLQELLTAPVVTIVEAKNDNPTYGLGQCAATMIGARLFNEREGTEVRQLFGASTSGSLWRFLQLEGNTLTLDQREYHLRELNKILGILIHFLRPEGAVAGSAA
jgi:hypothetical protein